MIKFRKIASVVASALMIGSTMGAAFAANYPAPFVSSGNANVAIVYGSNAAISDLSAAIDVQTNLNSKITGNSATAATTTGGNSVSLSTTSQQLLMNSTLNVARSVITKDHLPTLLADGSAYDSSGTEYKYTQTITPNGNSRQITFGKSGESIDPIMLVNLGYQGTSAPVYNYTMTLSKALNVTDTNVIGTAELNILGNKYVIGANSDGNTLYLYGSGQTTSVEEGETKTVDIDGEPHTISLIGTSSTTTATIEVDGVSKSITKGSSYKFASGFEIYSKDMFHATKTGTLSTVDLLVGSKTLHFEDGQAIRVGADDTTILGTDVEITSGSVAGGDITQIQVAQGAESSLGDYLKAGESYTDRVFGNLVLDFVGVVPTLESDTRDTVVLDTDNSVSARAKFTTDSSDKEYTMGYARDADNAADSSLTRVDLAYDNDLNISVQEGSNIKVNQYMVVNDNDEGRILQVISVPSGTSSNDYARLRDVITGVDYDFSTGLTNKTTAARSIGGSEYHLAVANTNADSALWTVNLTWGAGSAAGSEGTETTLFPRIKLANGEWISFLTSTSVNKDDTYQLPGNYLLSTYKTGSTLTWVNSTAAATFTNTTSLGNVDYNVTWTNATGTGTLSNLMLNGNNCNFNVTMGPAILIMEEKTLADSNGHAICIPLTSQGTNPKMPAIGTPIFSDGVASFNTMQSDTYKSQAVDLYGTLVERDTSSGTNYMVTVSYPDEQMYADVFFKEAGTSITPGSVGGSGSGSVMIVKDTEVDSVKDENLLVIGGSCVNTVARKIVNPDATSPICGADFTAATNVGAGQYLLMAVESPYNSARTAMQ
jgi:hypothetical protein